MRKILITGAHGFVGHHLIEVLKNDFTLLTPHRSEFDITDKDQIFSFLNDTRPDAIVHLAGLASTWQETEDHLMQVNFEGTKNLYEAVTQIKKYRPKILYIGSSDVYGEGKEGEKFDENAPLNPTSAYALSKAKADQLSQEFGKSLTLAIIRPFPHTGAGQRKGFFVPDMASQIVELEKKHADGEILVGNLNAFRDYLHVKDVVIAYKLLLTMDFEPGEVFNICSGEPIQIESLLNILLSLSTQDIKKKVDPARIRAQEASFRVGNNRKLQEKTGWKPQFTLDEALKDCLEYYRSHSE